MKNQTKAQYSKPRVVWNSKTNRRELQYEGLEGLKVRTEKEYKKDQEEALRRADNF